ncbi:helix-turn-helix domain-containing protein [Pseudonocardia sp. TRM90224]|uniref:helix-turn-helix domain-containing protein n=1 Tax=Pseudonocardia sp. TRM90224 TaxID=2812678 RepID=UPI0027E00362|nr:helix-turn-helix domain-containing protein [Pseudonocardia sp. TRM90224]
MTDWYSVDQVADQLGLNVRTVRTYVREGRLDAVRIGKQYRIARADLEALTGRPAEPERPPHVEVTSILDLEGIDAATAERVTALVTGLPAKGPRVEVVHDPARERLKVLVIGDLVATAELLRFVGSMVGVA